MVRSRSSPVVEMFAVDDTETARMGLWIHMRDLAEARIHELESHNPALHDLSQLSLDDHYENIPGGEC